LPIDIQILKLCHDNKWVYRQLINGKTLENKLFN
jgi:ABC-2 type transport system ATP-binding protein